MPLNLEGKSNSLNNCSWKTDYLAYLYPAFPFRFYSTAWRTSPRRLTRSTGVTTHNLLTLIKLDVADRLDLVLLVFVQYHLLPAGISIYSTEVKSKKRKTLSSFWQRTLPAAELLWFWRLSGTQPMLPNVRPYSGFSNLGLQERWSASFGLGRTTKKNCRLTTPGEIRDNSACNL